MPQLCKKITEINKNTLSNLILQTFLKERNNKSPLELAKVNIPDHINWINMIRNISS